MNQSADNHRSAYWDNAKAILIFLVVLGHIMLPIRSKYTITLAVSNWIYFFHTPAFVFVSGFFAKGYIRKQSSRSRRLTGFLLLYVFFKLSEWGLGCLLSGKLSFPKLFSLTSAPWYMLCMFFWYLILPYLADVGPKLALPGSVLLSLLVGTDPNCGSFLSLSRFFVFLPFFLGGYFFDPKVIRGVKPWIKGLSVAIFSGLFAAIYVFDRFLAPYLNIIYGSDSYSALGYRFRYGIAIRLIWYIGAAVVIATFLCLVPERKLFFTYIGERTLAIYIIHRLLRDIMSGLGVYRFMGSNYVLLLSCIAVSVVIVYISSGKRISTFFNRAFSVWPPEKPL